MIILILSEKIMTPERLENDKPKKIIDKVAGEHPNDESDIGGTQSNAGHLGLNQDERKERFTKGVMPKESYRLKRSVTSMRGEPEQEEFGKDEPGPALGNSGGETVED